MFLVTSSPIGFISTTFLALFGDRGGVSEDDAEVEALVDKCSLQVLKDHINLIDFGALSCAKQFADEVGNRENSLLVIRGFALFAGGVELLTHDIEEELEDISVFLDVGLVEGLHELLFSDVAVTLCVNRCQSLLQCKSLIGEYFRSDPSEYLLGPVECGEIVVVNLLLVVILQQRNLDDSCVVWIQLVHDRVDLFI